MLLFLRLKNVHEFRSLRNFFPGNQEKGVKFAEPIFAVMQ